MTVDKPTRKSAIFNIEFEKPDPGLAAFYQHKNDLLNNLRELHGRGPKSEPFDEDKAWRALIRAAQWYCRRPKIRQKTVSPARRVERLHDLAKALGRAHKMAHRALQDDVSTDLFRGWCAAANTSSAASGALNADRLTRIAEEITEVVGSLATLEAAASRAARNVPTKPGPTRGTGMLTMHDMNALEGVYQRSTGLKPNIGPGPFAQFVEDFLTAIGRGDDTSRDYVVEALKYARKQARKNPDG